MTNSNDSHSGSSIPWRPHGHETVRINRHPPIRAGLLTCLDACPRRFFWKAVLGLVPRRTEYSPALTVGTLFHELMRKTSEFIASGVIACPDAALAKAVGEVSDDVERTLVRLRQSALPDSPEETLTIRLEQALSVAKTMAVIFIEQYPPQTDSRRLLAIEREMTAPVVMGGGTAPDRTVYLAGRPDAVVSAPEGLWIIDYKTTSDEPSKAIRGHAWSNQTILYPELVEAYFDIPVVGFIYNIIRKPGIVLCRTDHKNADAEGIPVSVAYTRRVKEWYDQQSEKPFGSFCCRIPSERISDFVFKIRRVLDLYDFIDQHESIEECVSGFPRVAGSCHQFRRTCEYYDLCSSDPSVWPSLVSAAFDQQPDAVESENDGREDA